MVETIEQFKERWSRKNEEIKKQAFDRDTCYRILNEFTVEFGLWDLFKQPQGQGRAYEMVELRNDLMIALDIAYSNYRLHMRKTSWWSRLFSGDKKFSLFNFRE